jgi:predicted DNA-binding transcriptional regulator AlpA
VLKTATAPTMDVVLRAVVREEIDQALGEFVEHLSPPGPRAPDPLLDREGLAKALGVSLPTVDKLKRDKTFPTIKILDAPRFDLAEVRAWLRARPKPEGEAGE